MIYRLIKPGIFIERLNRFVARVIVDGEEQLCHVKNTGRCRELLIPGAEIFVQERDQAGRKTKYDLISVYKGSRLVNIDSQAPNQVMAEFLQAGGLFGSDSKVRREVQYKNSRFDFYIESGGEKCFMEVKGVTLEEGRAAMFPDAPTQRGVKHLTQLMDCLEHGYKAYVVFIIQMGGVDFFLPNWNTHPAFVQALEQAQKAGVMVLAYDCTVTERELVLRSPVKVRLNETEEKGSSDGGKSKL